MSFSEIVTSATITSLTTGQSVTTRLFGGGAYNLSVPVFGNDAYEIVIETNAGTFCINVYVSALPDYEPGDPRIMLPIDDPRKI